MDVNKNEGQERSMGILDKTKVYRFESQEDKALALANETFLNKDTITSKYLHIRYDECRKCWIWTDIIEHKNKAILWKRPMYDRENIYIFDTEEDRIAFTKELEKTEKIEKNANKTISDKHIAIYWCKLIKRWCATSEIDAWIKIAKRIPMDMTGQEPTPCPIKPPMTDFKPLDPSICYEFDNEEHAVEFCKKYWNRDTFDSTCDACVTGKMKYMYHVGTRWCHFSRKPQKPIQRIHGLEWPSSTSIPPQQSRGEEMNTTGLTQKVRQAAENLVTATESSRPMEPMQNFGMRLTWAALWPVRILLRTVGVSALNGARTAFNAATFGGLCYGAYWLYNNVHIQF